MIIAPSQAIDLYRQMKFFLLLPTLAFAVACDGPAAQDNGQPVEQVAELSFAEDPHTAASLTDFAGSWEAVADDGTAKETAELEVNDGVVIGVLRTMERGYFSGNVKVTAEASMRGTLDDGLLDIKAWDAQTGSEETAVSGHAMRRGEYMIIRIGDSETGYARPGVSVVESAEGSSAAESLAKSIAGHVYSTSSQASGSGAFVGSRVKLALCSDGTIAFDVSDLASTGGSDAVDMGSTMSRRGEWRVVLLAGAPAVRASWNGTGSSYSLTRYFRIQPAVDGSSARIDGTILPSTGSC